MWQLRAVQALVVQQAVVAVAQNSFFYNEILLILHPTVKWVFVASLLDEVVRQE
jgi:hypothetical protein